MASCERKDLQQTRDINCHYLEVPGDDPGFLVIASSIASKLEDLSCEVLHDGGQIDGGPGSHSLGVVPLAEQPGGQLENGNQLKRSYLWIRPTGNWRPARLDLDLAFTLDLPPLPRPDIAS